MDERLPIKATLYQHQRDAVDFACRLFGLTSESVDTAPAAECNPVLEVDADDG
ncbi:hypothetical protein FACS18949_15670 [Clostridia bacterium]|nr:hypothetical protein FACS18949_15670 [Clostridia bacterium]